jgi:DNA polymerase III delta prime subunit
MSNAPFVEKYRPKLFEDIVLDEWSEKIMHTIIKQNRIPNLLFYGPPGTGKTTTIMNLIDLYFLKQNIVHYKSLVLHLNASDERGIETIRSLINQFVISSSLFEKGLKFVILDEVDYMTKNAQQALKYMLENITTDGVRFCLICNYISKIDTSLQNEFMKIRFNELPQDKIIAKLQMICAAEKINLTDETLFQIQQCYKSDMRSMINFIQMCNETNMNNKMIINVIHDGCWKDLLVTIKEKDVKEVHNIIQMMCYEYNIESGDLLRCFGNYILRQREKISAPLLINIEHFLKSDRGYNEGVLWKYLILIMQSTF